MCIAIIKPAGIDAPSVKTLKMCWSKNQDGAGFCFATGREVRIIKGFLTWNDFIEVLKQYRQLIKPSVAMIHFRAATTGLVDEGNCHPYPVCKNFHTMRELNIGYRFALVHNGTVPIILENEWISDTMQMTKLIAKNSFDKISKTMLLNEAVIAPSRVAVLDYKGDLFKLGTWHTRPDGCEYSNLRPFEKIDNQKNTKTAKSN